MPTCLQRITRLPKKLEEGMTPAMLDMAREAKQSVEKLLGSAMKTVGKAPPEESKEVKVVIMKLKEIITSLEHVLLFEAGHCVSSAVSLVALHFLLQELHGHDSVNKVAFQKFMTEVANGTTSSNERFEQAKAVLKARGHQL